MARTSKHRVQKTNDFDTEISKATSEMLRLSIAGSAILEKDVITLYKCARSLFRGLMHKAGYPEEVVRALLTKYNDAGPRSAPWKPTSSKVPGRPQDGKDGNRIRRWELPKNHKFYSTQVDGTLVAIKYILQTLSMTGAPPAPAELLNSFTWLLGNELKPGTFRDPISKEEVHLDQVAKTPRIITSGHIIPLDRGGRHIPPNTSLILKSSNDLQGNNTVEELLKLIRGILQRHGRL